MNIFNKFIIILMCLVLLISCGRKNDPKYEASLNNSLKPLQIENNIFKMPKKNEVYQ